MLVRWGGMQVRASLEERLHNRHALAGEDNVLVLPFQHCIQQRSAPMMISVIDVGTSREQCLEYRQITHPQTSRRKQEWCHPLIAQRVVDVGAGAEEHLHGPALPVVT